MEGARAINDRLYSNAEVPNGRDYDHECGICLEPFLYTLNPSQTNSCPIDKPVGKRVVTQCDHTFHKTCLDRWQLEFRPKSGNPELENSALFCPMDRQPISYLTELPGDETTTDPATQNNTGRAYDIGLGVRKDINQAVQWYRKSAEQGFALAQNSLGVLLQDEFNNYVEAARWFTKAAEQGDLWACYNLYQLYKNGLGVDQDDSLAFHWCERGANLNHRECQFMLGEAYQYGLGVEIDHDKAVLWYEKAAEQGHSFAQNNLGGLYENTFKNYDKAKSMYLKAAERGCALAQNNLGTLYENTFKNYDKAKSMYLKAAERGDALAQNNLGALLQDEFNNYAEAARWYTKAAEQGEPCACYNLSLLYKDGAGVVQDDSLAVYWEAKAIEIEGNISPPE